MPIYEFYCADCHTLYNFFSSGIDTTARPRCPRCGTDTLERRPARFAMLKHTRGDEAELDDDDPFAGMDEERLERAMESVSGELETMGDEEDPRVMARFFRRFGEATGMDLGPRMESMLQRLEAGEDPDALDEEMGDDADEGDVADWFQLKKKAGAWRERHKRPRVDDTLYFL